MIEKIKNLLNLYSSFAKIGTFTIGGGLAMMPMMQAELIEKRKWITDEELIDYYTYQIKANQAKLDYLIKIAKRKGIVLSRVNELKTRLYKN